MTSHLVFILMTVLWQAGTHDAQIDTYQTKNMAACVKLRDYYLAQIEVMNAENPPPLAASGSAACVLMRGGEIDGA